MKPTLRLLAALLLAPLATLHALEPVAVDLAKRTWQGIPGLEHTEKGRIFSSWFTGGPKEPAPENTVVLSYSDDAGKTFKAPVAMGLPTSDGARCYDPCLWIDPKGRLWYLFNRSLKDSAQHGVYARICDHPDASPLVWSAEFRVGFGGPFSFRMNKPVVLTTGEWVMPVTHALEPVKAWAGFDPKQVQGVGISTDEGKTWTLHGAVKTPEAALENMIVELRDGRLWMLIRTANVLWESHSSDKGRTWTDGTPTTIATPHSRFFIRRLASGNLLLVNHRNFKGRSHLTAQLSTDDGATWNPGLLLDERNNVSYPDGVQEKDGLIWITYDRDRNGQGDILLAKFREEDVLAEKDVSGAVKLKQTINKLDKPLWEFAPAEKKAVWEQQRDALQSVDISDETARQVVIAQGTPQEYHAHPTTALLADNKTMFAVWNLGHGGHAGPVARSLDAGLTWSRLDGAMPQNYVNFRNCPSVYRITDPQGKERLWVFAASTLVKEPREFAGRLKGWMPRVVSEDDGKTWSEVPPLGIMPQNPTDKDWFNSPFRNVMTFSSMVRLKDGSTLGVFHRSTGLGEGGTLQVLQSITKDGGFTWSEPVMVCDGTQLERKDPCEPYVFRSPDGAELCCIMRENRRSGTSLVMFSKDEGQTWSAPLDTPWGLTGDRHHGIQLPDGRLVIVSRNTSPIAKDKGGFIAWVGTYDDIKNSKPGQYRISLLKSFKDGFYPGLHLLPDGTIVATTYATYRKDDGGCSIVSVRFKMSEIDALTKQEK